jgi:predicted MFS family arabinose efflux permease
MQQTLSVRDETTRALSAPLIFLLALSCGLIAANLYYAQPLIEPIGQALGMSSDRQGLLVTLTQLGYGLGLVLLAPLGDLVENRRLVVVVLAVACLSLLVLAGSSTTAPFLVATFVLGMAVVTVQLLMPYAAQFASDRNRGRVIGALTSGLMLGVMLARPAASLITFWLGWRAVFMVAAAALAVTAVMLAVAMPTFRPRVTSTYGVILRSLPALLRDLPVLRSRAAYHVLLFAGFSLFWTGVPLVLAGPPFGLTQAGIGLFALAGGAGVVTAPIAGRIADRDLTRPATGVAIMLVLCSFALALWAGEIGSIAGLVVGALLIDAGLVLNFVLSQRALYEPRPESRSRIGGLFTALFFLGGGAGSALAASSYAAGGWTLTSEIGLTLAAAALLLYAKEIAVRR